MSEVKIGNIVARKSYGYDLVFKVVDIKKSQAGDVNIILRGVDYRIEANAPESDLKLVSQDESEQASEQVGKWVDTSINNIKVKRDKELLRQTRVTFYRAMETFQRSGKILHIDGAKDFISKCKEHYVKLGLEAQVLEIPENEQPLRVKELLREYNPDMLVLTGHDSMIKDNTDYSKLESYKNSIHFVNAVKEARKYEKSLDCLVIFAGACQSNYEAILDAGANFSSSPKRVLIHMFDPVAIAERVANTKIDKILSINEAVENTKAGLEGIGGVETRGKARLGGPKMSY